MKTVDIVLATYKPNIIFLKKLLKSLNSQTYPKIKLIVRDDSGNKEEFEKISTLIKEHITNFEYNIFKNNINVGSNKTFENLTKDATADYIAYCDQDDIWEKDKITKLVNSAEEKNAVISYSDLSVIDKDDNIMATSFKDIHKRLKHVEGNFLFKYFLRRNSITGCTMLIKSGIAKRAIPFCSDYYVHDHWLALFSSTVGEISYVPEPLIKYRIHEGNQIGADMLSDIESKEDYYKKKLLMERKKFSYLLNNNKFDNNYKVTINNILNWTEERISFFEKKNISTTFSMLTKIKDDHQLILFEIAINYLPNRISKKLIKKVKK
ncbi:glycosyltransferase [Jeotgalibaca dankookensis]|uniref:glycosyltransferase n=1 Tax=Jeotgalibaca dankookensis TaxID=708126 RepID=UPI000782D299|nr:glycosyltransferase [Jeotgalibaca dankookensis]